MATALFILLKKHNDGFIWSQGRLITAKKQMIK